MHLVKIMAVVGMFGLVSACGDEQSTNLEVSPSDLTQEGALSSGPYGKWLVGEQDLDEDVHLQATTTVYADKLVNESTCDIYGQRITAKIACPARVTSTTISVLNNGEVKKSVGDNSCTAICRRGSHAYQRIGNVLHIYADGQDYAWPLVD